jgi:hypothetical protein
MPDVSDQERGRRFFQLQKQKHAEEALDRARKSLGDSWKGLSLPEIKTLRFMLGEAWVFTERKDWDGFSFSRLSLTDLDEILRIGRSCERKEKNEHDAAKEVIGILKRVS